jgi:uncharacterized peroxidase-related enzyme
MSIEFDIHDGESAPKDARERLEARKEELGMVPNLYGIMANSPPVLDAYLDLYAHFEETSLTPVEQQVVVLAVSFQNRCEYCMSVHSAIAGMVDADPQVVEALRSGEPIENQKLQSLRTFVEHLHESRGFADEDAIEAFLAAGYRKAQVLEVVVGLAAKTLSNYVNHLADTPVDEAFAKTQWTAPEEEGG